MSHHLRLKTINLQVYDGWLMTTANAPGTIRQARSPYLPSTNAAEVPTSQTKAQAPDKTVVIAAWADHCGLTLDV